MSLSSRLLPFRKLCSAQPNCLRFFRTSIINSAEDIYKVLGLKHNATQREIKEAFYNLSKKYHPDISKSTDSGAKFKEIMSAYEILGDPVKRADYDRGLVLPKSSAASTEFPSAEDMDILKKYDSGSFESNYARSYNRNLKAAWANRADENISKSAFDYRIDQRKFVSVMYFVVLSMALGAWGIAKYYEEPVPIIEVKKS